MLKLTIIGNLGADAELRKDQGREFVSLSIAHTERRRGADGAEREVTTWVSATLNGDGGNLLPFLKKGTKVFAYGDCDVRTFHSEKERCLKAGLKLFIRNIELVGSIGDDVPRDLYDMDGVAHRVTKHYYCQDVRSTTLFDRGGSEFLVGAAGWVSRSQVAAAQDPADGQATAEPAQADQASSVAAGQESSTNEKKESKEKSK